MLSINEIALENYRCFHDRQVARLAPLTLLVGDNNTGKTSFLAMVRALWDTVYRRRTPDFKEEPYDLGSFDEIAHHRGAKGGRADKIRAEVSYGENFRAAITLARHGTEPVPVQTHLARGSTWIEDTFDKNRSVIIRRVGTSRGVWERVISEEPESRLAMINEAQQIWPVSVPSPLVSPEPRQSNNYFKPLEGSPRFLSEDAHSVLGLLFSDRVTGKDRPFASAPVRSKPRRTYDPARTTPDPEGDYVPMYLANVFSQDERRWTGLKNDLQRFGKDAGLFDEVSIQRLGKNMSGPFQVQVRKFGSRLKGPKRNLIDVGYGVSQVLPVIAELMRPGAPRMFLLQQPEVHLHPSAQAALGSLFCQVAGKNRQLIVETHSDHLMNRIRMDVRDGRSKLRPGDVSILFFERRELDVHIHSLRLDQEGNLQDVPRGYRSFFMEETKRSLGL